MAPCCQLCALWGQGLEKGQWPLLTFMPDTSISPSMPPVPFKLLPWLCSSEGVSRELPTQASPCVGSLRGTAWCSSSFFYLLNPLWCLQAEVVGTYFLALKSQAGGLGLFAPEIPLPNLYTHGYWTNLFHICTPPTSLDRCGFFNSVVVRLPFRVISDVPE